jgi:DNA repair protein RadA/Sms
MNYRLFQSDIFVSVAGGWKISEPALDLGVIMAIASSFSSRHLDTSTLAIGEVGLSGEVRQVSRVEVRLQEALQMGFTRCILPRSSLRSISKGLQNQIELIPVEVVDEAVKELARPN